MNLSRLTPDEIRDARAARLTGLACVLEHTALVEVRGEDAARHLEAMCTRDLSGLDPGEIRYAALLDDLAHYLADFWIWRVGESWWLETESSLAEALAERLTRFAVSDDAEASVLEGTKLFHLEGPLATRAAESIVGATLSADAAGTTSGIAWARRSRFGDVGITLVAEGEVPDVWKTAARAAGLVQATAPMQESMRIEGGHARGGVDMTSVHLLPEIGLWGAVSLDKGCFPGQEIIRRVVSRGEVKRRLIGFVENESMDMPPNWEGFIEPTSVAFSASLGKIVGLAWARARQAVPGAYAPLPPDDDEGNSYLFTAAVAALPLVSGPLGVPPDVPGEREENKASR